LSTTDIKNIIDWWHKIYFPILFAIGGIVLLISFKLLYAAISFIIILIWCYKHRLPKFSKKSLGILFFINANDEINYNKLMTRFETTISNLMILSDSINFKIIYLDYWHVKYYMDYNIYKSNANYRKKIDRKMNARYVIYGNSNLLENNKLELIINASVYHGKLKEKTHRSFTNEFSNLFYNIEAEKIFHNKFLIDTNNSLTFQILSEHLELTAKYIIGRAIFLSGYFYIAQIIFEELEHELAVNFRNINIYQKLQKHCNCKLYEVYYLLATMFYHHYRIEENSDYLNKLGFYLNKLETYNRYSNNIDLAWYEFALLKAIFYFLNDRDTNLARQVLLEKCQNNNNPNWLLSLGFLYAYDNRVLTSYKKYKAALKKSIDENTISAIDEFTIKIYESEPDRIGLSFALAIINFHFKKDFHQANEYLEIYRNNQLHINNQVNKLIESYMAKINKKLSH